VREERISSFMDENIIVINIIILSGIRLGPLGTAAITVLLYQPRMIDDGDCGTIGGRKFGTCNEKL
jgi:hypothetical protein